jgi:hypothetical protein
MSEIEPGLERHISQVEYEAMEDDLRTTPAESLPELLDLVERMAEAHGYDAEPDTTSEAPDVAAGLARARELVERIDAGDEVRTDDASQTIAELRSFYLWLQEEPVADLEDLTDGA